MDATKEIKRIMLETDTSLTELAERLETSTNNINNKMRRNNWRTSELKEIFGCMGYDVELKVTKMPDEYDTYKYIEQFINIAGNRVNPNTLKAIKSKLERINASNEESFMRYPYYDYDDEDGEY